MFFVYSFDDVFGPFFPAFFFSFFQRSFVIVVIQKVFVNKDNRRVKNLDFKLFL